MRVAFSSMTTARAAADVLEAYGYSTKQFGRDVVTDCPPLLAVPVIANRIGLAEIERLDLTGGTNAIDARTELSSVGDAASARSGSEIAA